MKHFIVALTIILFIFACSGSSNNNSNSRQPVSSALDLRLGQLSNSSSPVAISAALQNGESITIYANNLYDEFEAIYVAPNNNSLQIKLDFTGKPIFTQTQNTSIAYTNYTKENTVDITVQNPETSRRTRSFTYSHYLIEKEVLAYLNDKDFINIILDANNDSDSGIRALLAATVGAFRLVGCSSSEFLPDEFSTNLCNSLLLDKIEFILSRSRYEEITVNLTNRHPECDNPSNFEEESACAIVIWKELVEAAKQGIVGDYPRNNNSNSGSSSTGGDTGGSSGGVEPTPTLTNTPTPTATITNTPTPTNTPIQGGGAGFLGSWSGGGSGDSNCPTTNFNVAFNILAESAQDCISAPCVIAGSIISSNGLFPTASSLFTGSVLVNNQGAILVRNIQTNDANHSAVQAPPTILMFNQSGQYSINGGFIVTPGTCNLLFNFTRN